MGDERPVGPLERGLRVMEVIGGASSPPRPADLVPATGLVRSTVDRVLSTLEATGYLRSRGREVAATPRMMEAGNAYLSALDPDRFLARRAAALADELDESVSLAVPDGDGVRFVGQSPRRRSLSVAFRIGDLLPAERCAPGPLFAAEWGDELWRAWEARVTGGPRGRRFSVSPFAEPSVIEGFRGRVADFRASGRSLDEEFLEPGLIAVAVPVRAATGGALLALSVVSHTSRHTAESLYEQVREPVAACVAEMEEHLARPPRAEEPLPPGTEANAELKERLGAHFLQSLDRGLAVLHALGARPGGLTISEAAAATGQPRATARRALLSLAELGYVREDGRHFRLLPRVLDLGYRRVSEMTFEQLARPHLRDLVVKVHDSASVAVLDGTDIRYVARAQASRLMRADIHIGTRFPAYATAMGRVLLAGLPEPEAAGLIARSERRAFTPFTLTGADELGEAVAAARRDGYALVDQELETGLRSLSVPVHAEGRAVAALNLAVPATAEPVGEMCERLLPHLAAAARAIDADLAALTRHQPLTL
ncbi:IclR family transcriptional regulator domain-containing protein [Actinocorallia populi]|uniref:IclR family transcriptional regulator domain-containing protein n=1 Tax=Actinocorallia populi TaxID=2079200 RepID=UPI000D088CC6|nr:IclR family transcriptional regulator C-terminal domain-containing protein [Actinocorallia populi]